MYVGTYGDVVFSVGHLRVLTPSNVSGEIGADWATHEVVGGKSRSQYIGPALRTYQMDLKLSASFGVNPRMMLTRLHEMCENGEVHYLIIGPAPLSTNKFKLTSLSETWDVIARMGILTECTVTASFEEYI